VAIENVSSTSDIHCTRLSHCTLDCRSVAEIQGKIVEKREWNSLSRLAHAKNNRHSIAAWKLNPTRTIQASDASEKEAFDYSLVALIRPYLSLLK